MSMALQSFCWAVLFMIPSAIELPVLSSVASCRWTISERVVRRTMIYFVLTNTAPNSASLMEETTCLRTLELLTNVPLERGVADECVVLPR
jgi:hypothetical protein